MKRFLGAEGVNESPYMRLRVGRILEVYHDAAAAGVPSESNKALDYSLGKVKVEWLDWGGQRDYLQLSFPVFSNFQASDGADGLAYGDMSMPSPNDIVIVALRGPNNGVVIGFLPMNYNQQTNPEIAPSTLGTMRRVEPGEFSRKSKQQAEIYQDKAGAIQIIVKAQPTSGGETDGSGTDAADDIDPATAPSEELARVTIGETYADGETLATRATAVTSGKKVVLQVKMASGAKLDIDVDGNIELTPASGKLINLAAGTKGVARVDDPTAGHAHDVSFSLTCPDGAVSGTITIASATDTIGSGSTKVKAG